MKHTTTLAIITILFFTYACNNAKTAEEPSSTNTIEITEMSQPITLTQALAERKEKASAKVDTSTKNIYKTGMDAVENSGVLLSAKKVGDTAPDFSLKNALGETVSLSTYLGKGPVVLTWYRGGWCPYCNLTLHHLQQELPNFKAQGANLIAISPETPDNSISTKEKHELAFEVLSDKGNTIAKKYGVSYKLTKELAAKYNEKFELNKHNGDTSNELPLAATYVIDTEGKIAYAFVDFDYRNRAEPTEITAFLKTMNTK